MNINPKTKRTQVNLYPTYLRLLDADSSGATKKEMAQNLFPELDNDHPDFNGSQRVRDNLKAAKELRDSRFGPHRLTRP